MKVKAILKLTALCLLVLAVPCLCFTACASGKAGNKEQVTGNSTSNSGKLPQGNVDVEVYVKIGSGKFVSYSPDNKSYLTIYDRELRLSDNETNQLTNVFINDDGEILYACFNHDGRFIAATSKDIVYILDAKTFRVIHKLNAVDASAIVSFSPDGKKIISAEKINYKLKIILWDINGNEKNIITYNYDFGKERNTKVEYLTFSVNSKSILCVTNDNFDSRIFSFNTSNGKLNYNRFIDADISSFSNYDKRLCVFRLFSIGDKTVIIVDLETGKDIYNKKLGKSERVLYTNISPNEKYLVTQEVISTNDYRFRVFDILSDKEIINKKNKDSAFIRFSTDHCEYNLHAIQKASANQYLFTYSNIYGIKNSNSLYDLKKGIDLLDKNNSSNLQKFNGGISFGVFSNNGITYDGCINKKNIITNSDGISKISLDTEIKLDDTTISDNKKISKVNRICTSSDGRFIATEGSDINIWDAKTGHKLHTFRGRGGLLGFDSSGRYLITKTGYTQVYLYDIETGEYKNSGFKAISGDESVVRISPDGRLVVTENYSSKNKNYEIKVYDLKNNKLLIETNADTFHSNKNNLFLDFSQNSQYFISAYEKPNGKEYIIEVWDIDKGKNIYTHTEGGAYYLKISPDGRFIGLSEEYFSKEYLIIDIKTGNKRKIQYNHIIRDVIISPDWKYIYSKISQGTDSGKNSLYGKNFNIYNVIDGSEVITFSGHMANINSSSFDQVENKIITASDDNTIRIWDITAGKEVMKLVSFSGNDSRLSLASRGLSVVTQTASSNIDGEWISITPDGYYAASPRGDRFLNILINNTVSGIDSYRSVFYNPDVVQARLQGKPDPASKSNITIQQAANFTPPQVTIKSPSTFTTTSNATTNLSVTVTDKNQSIKNIKIFVNGRAVSKNELAAIKGSNLQAEKTSLTVTGNQKTVNFDLPITLDPGRNLIEVVAFNGFSESARLSPIEVTYNAPAGQRPPLPNLWILAIGVNNYDNVAQVGSNLRFAVTDAKRLTEALKSQEGKRYAKVNTLVIGDGEATLPTAENIKKSLAFLDSAGERDTVLLFLAGHGVSAQNGRFFFLPKDAVVTGSSGNWKVDEKRAISGEEITAVLEGQGNRLLFIDACQSGGVDNNRMIRAMMESNAFVFAASQGNEFSYEDTRWGGGHGVFTYNVLNALKGAPNALAEGNVSVRSMSGFVSLEVPKMTDNRQNPKVHSLLFADFPLAVVK